MHGWLGTSYTWRHVAPLLVKAGYKVVVPDMRGYGDSDKPTSGYDGLTLVEDMRQLLKQAGVPGKVHVVGWDMGALPAYLFAATYPSEVSSLAYLDEPLPSVNLSKLTSFTKENYGGYWHFGFNYALDLPELLIEGREKEFWNYLYSLMLFNPEAITEADKAEYLRTYAAAGGIKGSVGWYRAALTTTDQFSTAIAKGKLKLPVFGMGGQYGTVYTKDQLSTISDNVKGGIAPNCGHMIAEEVPDFLTKSLLDFYKGKL
jgi:pimeloyl-ACP methyl ester carboxylesterase